MPSPDYGRTSQQRVPPAMPSTAVQKGNAAAVLGTVETSPCQGDPF